MCMKVLFFEPRYLPPVSLCYTHGKCIDLGSLLRLLAMLECIWLDGRWVAV